VIKTISTAINQDGSTDLMYIAYMVYGLDTKREAVIPYGFYRTEERAKEKAEELEQKSSNGVTCYRYEVQRVEFDV